MRSSVEKPYMSLGKPGRWYSNQRKVELATIRTASSSKVHGTARAVIREVMPNLVGSLVSWAAARRAAAREGNSGSKSVCRLAEMLS